MVPHLHINDGRVARSHDFDEGRPPVAEARRKPPVEIPDRPAKIH